MNFGTNPIRVEDLVANLVQQVQSKAGIPRDCVFETLADEQDHCEFPTSDRFILVTPQRFTLVPGGWSGGGRYTPGYDSIFRVAALCRYAADQELRNTRELRDKTRAAIALSLSVLDALSGFTMPTDADPTQSYLREPISNVDFDVRPKRVKGGPWAVVASTWRVNFVLALPSGTSDP
jgi:hypothetical protein